MIGALLCYYLINNFPELFNLKINFQVKKVRF